MLDVPAVANALRACTQCGRCLPSCPTYRVHGTEGDSPRGRVWLMRGLWGESGDPAAIGVAPADIERHLAECLDCRACEVVCPSEVPVGTLVAASKELMRAGRRRPLVETLALAALRRVLLRPRWLALAAHTAYWARPIGRAALRLAPTSVWAKRLAESMDLAPRWKPSSRELPRVVPASGVKRGKVALFTGCVMRAAFAETNAATARVLARNGFEVHVPPQQRCCGALLEHNGDVDGARRLARQNIAVFEVMRTDATVVNAAGCGAFLKAYAGLFRDDPDWSVRAARLAASVRDAAEHLANVGLNARPGRLDLTVAYQDPCHLLNVQRIRSQPRALLRSIEGLRCLTLNDEQCCGSAGTYNLTHPETARELGSRKAAAVTRTSPDVLVTANPGCHLQIEAALRRGGSDIRVMHLMDVLDSAYRAEHAVRAVN